VLQSKEEPIEVATTNELGEFLFDLVPIPDLRLEVGINENHWISVQLPDSNGVNGETKGEFDSPGTTGGTGNQQDPLSSKRKRGQP
jgi:hypothetical protein